MGMKAADERQRSDAERQVGSLPADVERRLRQVFVARYGWERGIEVWRDVVTYAWQHRERLSTMANPTGYLYRVGQSAARRYGRMSRHTVGRATKPRFTQLGPRRTRFQPHRSPPRRLTLWSG